MKIKALMALALALVIASSAFVFASCTKPGGEPTPSDVPASSGEPDATVTAAPDETPEVIVYGPVNYALEDYYALKEGDFSLLEKYWNGSLSAKITAEGEKLEKAVYGAAIYRYAVPPVITEERWDKMMTEAEEKYKDVPGFEFVRTKLEGFYVLRDRTQSNNPEGRNQDKLVGAFADRFGFDVSNVEKAYFIDTNVSDGRMREVEGYFTEYFGYTIEDVRDASREVGIPDADLIGTVEPYFVFEYSDYGERVGAVEYSEEATEKLESLCREYVDGDGNPLCYGKYEYKVTAVQEVSYGDEFNEIRDEYKELTGEDLQMVCKITLEEKKIGETVAATGEYRKYSAEEVTDTGFEEIFLCISDNGEWEPEKIDFPWGGSARRVLILYAEVFDD